MVNVSTAGILCETPARVEPMSRVGVTLLLPESEDFSGDRLEIECEGVVIRSEKKTTQTSAPLYHIAVYFTQIDDQDRDLIARHVERDLGGVNQVPET